MAGASPEVEARLRVLSERRRAGRVDEARLLIAAALGDEDAVRLVELPAELDLAAIVRLAGACRSEGLVRLAAAGAREVFDRHELWLPDARGWLLDAEAYARCPCPPHRERAAAVHDHQFPFGCSWSGPAAQRRVLAIAAETAAARSVAKRTEACRQGLEAALASLAEPGEPEPIRSARHRLTHKLPVTRDELAVLRPIGARIVPWLLGEGDPLAPPPPTRVDRAERELLRREAAGDAAAPVTLGALRATRDGQRGAKDLRRALLLGAELPDELAPALGVTGDLDLAGWLAALETRDLRGRVALLAVAGLPSGGTGGAALAEARALLVERRPLHRGWVRAVDAALADPDPVARLQGSAARLSHDTTRGAIERFTTALAPAGIGQAAVRERARALLPWVLEGKDPLAS